MRLYCGILYILPKPSKSIILQGFENINYNPMSLIIFISNNYYTQTMK